MREYLAKMTLRQISLWLMVMLDPAYKTLSSDRSLIPSENEYPKSVKCLLEKSITIFQRLLAADHADKARLQDDIVAVLNAAHHITAIPSGQAWVGRAVYAVTLGIELLLDTLIVDRRPNRDGTRSEVDNRMVSTALDNIESAVPEIAQKERTEAYYHRLDTLGATLNEIETLIDDEPFGQPIPSDLIESTLKDTYFDEGWRKANP
jgi:hypothetical protein